MTRCIARDLHPAVSQVLASRIGRAPTIADRILSIRGMFHHVEGVLQSVLSI